MSTTLERKFEDLQRKLQARTQRDGTPRPGYAQNVARIKAEMEIISGRIELARRASTEEDNNGE